MNYGSKLKEIREERELLQKDLAKVLNIHKDVYGQYEREQAIIPIKHLITLSNYLNVSIDYLFNLTTSKQYPTNQKPIDKITIGKRLKDFRKSNHLSQEELANLLNTTHSVISDYEHGRYIIATPFLYTICKTYHISADYLLSKIDSNILIPN